MPVVGKEQLHQQDMELMDILYLQDIDIGVVRDSFNGNYQAELDTAAFTHEKQPASFVLDNKDDDKQANCHFIVDGETGEMVPVTLNSADSVSSLTIESQSLANSLQIPRDYNRQSSFDERLLDVYDILGLPTSAEEQPATVTVYNQQFSVADPFGADSMTATALNDCRQYNENGSTASESMDMLIDGLDSYQFKVNSSAHPCVFFDNDGLSKTCQYVNSPGAIESNSVMAPSMLTPNSNSFELNPDISDFFNAGGLDHEAMSLFVQADSEPIPNDFIPVSTGLSGFCLEQSDLSLTSPALPYEYDCTNAQDNGFVMESEPLTSFSVVAVDGLGDMHTMAVPILEQPAVVGGIVTPIEGDSTDSLFQQILLNDLADSFDFDIVTGDSVMETAGYKVADDDYSCDSAISSLASLSEHVDGFQPASSSPAMGTRNWVKTGLLRPNIRQAGSMKSEIRTYDLPAVLTSKPQYNLNTISSPEYTEVVPSLVPSGKNIEYNRIVSKSTSRSRDKVELEYGELDSNGSSNRSRDEKRAKALKIPMTMDEIIDSSVEEFTEVLNQHKLTEAQLQLIRDIRRRGKNKMAAQNCRKRKMEVIGTLEEQVVSLRDERDLLLQERADLDKKFASLKDRFRQLESQLFQQVRDKSGRAYDRSQYSLLQTDEGGVFIIPRVSKTQQQLQQPVLADGEKTGRKRKFKEMN